MSVKGKGKAYKWMLAHAEYQHDEWCLVWPFSRDRHGRGMMGHDGKHHWAHRFMCTLVHGDPPTPQHQAAHSCGHGEDGCVNPLHLDWKTPSENVTDRWKHNGYLIHTKHGTARRLVPSQARAIASAKGIRTQAELAAQFGVSENVITNIWSERTYRDDSKIAYWTPEQIEILRTSIASGMNFTQIGRAVGKPSPAVSQKAYRLGLKSGQAPTYQKTAEPGADVPNGMRGVEGEQK